jgi:predicted HNH restriction endonuclease
MVSKKSKLYVLQSISEKGKENYTESELILPALEFLRKKNQPVSTSDLIAYLEGFFKPTGHDAKILLGRNDTYFSQKVRNLKSHDSLEKLGLAQYKSNKWKITDVGRTFLDVNNDIIQKLMDQGFKPEQLIQLDEYDYSNIIIEEGAAELRKTINRKRSDMLKAIAVSEFKVTNQGKVFCTVCSFDFLDMYGEHGRDFIEVHHTEPLHEKDIRGEKTSLKKALPKIALVCSNCHRMIHRKRGKMLSISAIKKIVKDHKCAGNEL